METIKDLIFFNHKQRTAEWHEARRGKFSASAIWKLFDTAERDKYIEEVVAERMGVVTKQDDGNRAYSWGVKYEPIALKELSALLGATLLQPGFVESREFQGWFGASPDAIEKSYCYGVEIKCLSRATYNKIKIANRAPRRHELQMAGGMIATGIPTWFYAVYHPDEELLIKHYSKMDLADDINLIRNELPKAIEKAKIIMGGTNENNIT